MTLHHTLSIKKSLSELNLMFDLHESTDSLPSRVSLSSLVKTKNVIFAFSHEPIHLLLKVFQVNASMWAFGEIVTMYSTWALKPEP